MGLNVSSGNMYDFITHTWNTVKGKCHHDCQYCYMKKFGEQKPVRFDEKELKTDLGLGNFIFVGSSCDMWSKAIPDKWINKTLEHCIKYSGNNYFFQTKNPARISEFIEQLSIINPVVCTTIETNREYPAIMRHSPDIVNRVFGMMALPFDKYVTVEPVLDFDVDEMVNIIEMIRPIQVNIGADSGAHGLPEPGMNKIIDLSNRIKRFTRVVYKKNLDRIC